MTAEPIVANLVYLNYREPRRATSSGDLFLIYHLTPLRWDAKVYTNGNRKRKTR